LKWFPAARRTGGGAHWHEAAATTRSELELMVERLKLRFLVQEECTGEVVPWENGFGWRHIGTVAHRRINGGGGVLYFGENEDKRGKRHRT
jgi:hypothetical protein